MSIYEMGLGGGALKWGFLTPYPPNHLEFIYLHKSISGFDDAKPLT